MSKERNGVKYSAVLRPQIVSILYFILAILSTTLEPASEAMVQPFLTTLFVVIGIKFNVRSIKAWSKYNK